LIRPATGRGRNPAVAWDPVPTPVLGEHEKALDRREPPIATPYLLSLGWLAINPNFAPRKGNPRFENLLRKTG
jgi:hypothetical protein